MKTDEVERLSNHSQLKVTDPPVPAEKSSASAMGLPFTSSALLCVLGHAQE
jgi:hypothetical protein